MPLALGLDMRSDRSSLASGLNLYRLELHVCSVRTRRKVEDRGEAGGFLVYSRDFTKTTQSLSETRLFDRKVAGIGKFFGSD